MIHHVRDFCIFTPVGEMFLEPWCYIIGKNALFLWRISLYNTIYENPFNNVRADGNVKCVYACRQSVSQD